MTIHIREISDLHLEHLYDLYDKNSDKVKDHIKTLIPVLPTDKKTVLIVAGDLATARRPNRIATFFELVVPRFKHVIYVLGNHEHYGVDIADTHNIITTTLSSEHVKLDMSKLTVIGNTPERIKIDDVTFIGATMWTDYNGGNSKSAKVIEKYIVDHKTIKNGDSTFTTKHAREIHLATLQIFAQWMTELAGEKVVVITHHLPSFRAVDPQYMLDEPCITLNAAFASDLDAFILKYQPNFWFFGHTHTSYSGKIGNTGLECNPFGYPVENNLNTGVFNPTKIHSL
jgi:predicted MPP superfamily phosphohydrolase